MVKTDEKPKKLTAAAQAFAASVVAGMTKAEAYRKHFPRARGWKESTLWTEASRLASDQRVRELMAELQSKAAEASIFTLADHLRNLHTISTAALEAKDFNAAARAEEARGKAAGFYVQRTELTGKNGGPIETKQTRDLTEDELDEQLRAHGIDPDSIKPSRPSDARH